MTTEFRELLFILIIIFFTFPLNGAQLKDDSYHGYSGIIDLRGIEYPSSQEVTEEWVKRVSAEITGIYISKGYMAFNIEQVLVKDDGLIEFYFNESEVSSVILSGTGESEAEAVGKEIFSEGSPYNEIILKKNIAAVKSKYGYRNVHVLLERDSNGKIVVNAKAVKIVNRFRFSASGDNIYGTIPEVSWYNIREEGFLWISLNSSLGQRDARVSNFSLFYNRNFYSTTLLTGLRVSERRDYFSSNVLYESRSFSPEAALYHYEGPMGAGFFIKGDYYLLENYNAPGESREFSCFSGLRLIYDNSPYVIERSEKKNFTMEISGGGNSIEGNGDLRLKSAASFSFHVLRRCALVFKNNFFMTTEDERLFSEYVFDNSLPGRLDDYSFSDLKNSTGLAAEFEIYPSLLYAGPAFYYGIYRDIRNDYRDASSAGLSIHFELKGAAVEGAYIFDTSGSVKEGGFLFSVSGTF